MPEKMILSNVGDILKGILNLSEKKFAPISKELGKGENLIKNLLSAAATNIARQSYEQQQARDRLQSSISGTPTNYTQQLLNKNLSTEQLYNIDEEKLNPLQQNALKTVKNIQKKQIEEAMQSGVPAESILQNMNIGTPTRNIYNPGPSIPSQQGRGVPTEIPSPVMLDDLTKSFTNQQNFPWIISQDQRADNQNQRGLGILGRMRQALSQPYREAEANIEYKILNNLLAEQQLRGEVPLQKGEKEKFEFQSGSRNEELQLKEQNDFFKRILQPESASGDVSKQLNFSQEAGSAAKELINILNQNPSSLKQIAFPGNKVGQRVKTLLDKIKANLAPARGGANLSEQELKLINSLIPKRGLTSFIENQEESIYKLKGIIKSTDRIANSLQPNKQLQSFIKSEIQRGTSREEIYSFLRSQGEI